MYIILSEDCLEGCATCEDTTTCTSCLAGKTGTTCVDGEHNELDHDKLVTTSRRRGPKIVL